MKPKGRSKKIVFFLIIVILVLMAIPLSIEFSVNHKIYSDIKKIPANELGIVLGADIKPDQEPGKYLKPRLDDALALYHAGKIKKILVSGDNGTHWHDEISVMNNYLVKNGVPQEAVYGDYAGFDTYSSMERAEKIFGVKKAIIISQGFHLPRAVYIAQRKRIQAVGYASIPAFGRRKYFIREYLATLKAFIDCARDRKAKFYGEKVDLKGSSNIKLKQLRK